MTYVIAVACDRGHPEKPWQIGEFELSVLDDTDPLVGADAVGIDYPPMWLFGQAGGGISRQGQRAARKWIAPDGHALTRDEIYGAMTIEDDGSITGTAGAGIPPGSWLRWQFECGRCHYNVTMRDDVLTPKLDELAAAGVTAISLAALAGVA